MMDFLSDQVTLVADTNLFLECMSLRDLPWDELGYTSVELIVCRPVLQELDKHKKQERGRTFKKALDASKLLRPLVAGRETALVIRESKPRVVLSLMPTARIQSDLNAALDPSSNDDAIILRMLQYQSSNHAANVRLITHDAGPMTTARDLGIPYIAIPDAWLLPQRDDATTKDVKKLAEELKRLRSQEPQFVIKVADRHDNDIARLSAKVDHYEALMPHEIEDLLERIKSKFPMSTEFGSEQTTPQPPRLPGLSRFSSLRFKPASEQEIQEYQQRAYPEWLSLCRGALSDLHNRLNGATTWPEIVFRIGNTGTRPAKLALVRFSATGNFKMFPLSRLKEDNGRVSAEIIETVVLPNPPSPPRAIWEEYFGHPDDLYTKLLKSHFGGSAIAEMDKARLPLDALRSHAARDPDKFYWKDGRPLRAQRLLELTCENWRHGLGSEDFSIRITPSADRDLSGAIQCELHAENLSDPVTMILPVSIERDAAPTLVNAHRLIEQLRNR